MRPSGARIRTGVGLVLAGALLACAGCGPPGDAGDLSLEVRLGVSPTPPIQGPTRLLVEVADPDGAPAGPGTVDVEGSPDGGGEARGPEPGVPQAPGRWVVPSFDFRAPGPWTVVVRVRLDDGRQTVRRFPVRVTPGDGGEAPPGPSAGPGIQR